VSNAWSNVAAFVPKFAVFLLVLIVGYRLVSRVHGQKSGRQAGGAVRETRPVRRIMIFDNPNGLGGLPSYRQPPSALVPGWEPGFPLSGVLA
jgi:hypothetical protein